jgi:hypothetical protein
LRSVFAALGHKLPDPEPPVAHFVNAVRTGNPRPLINPIHREFFGPHRPASKLVEISRPVRDDLLIEIQAEAQLPDA